MLQEGGCSILEGLSRQTSLCSAKNWWELSVPVETFHNYTLHNQDFGILHPLITNHHQYLNFIHQSRICRDIPPVWTSPLPRNHGTVRMEWIFLVRFRVHNNDWLVFPITFSSPWCPWFPENKIKHILSVKLTAVLDFLQAPKSNPVSIQTQIPWYLGRIVSLTTTATNHQSTTITSL